MSRRKPRGSTRVGIGLALPWRVTVRITVEEASRRRVVRVEGRLTAEEIAELEGVLGDDGRETTLQLENLRSADAAGIAALRRLRAAGVVFCAVPPRIAYEIEDEDG